MNRADRQHSFETQSGKLIQSGFRGVSIDFIDRDDHGFSRFTQKLGNFAIQRNDSFLNVHNENDYIRGFNREIHLINRRPRNDVRRFFPAQQTNAAGINESERTSENFGLGADAVARDARLIVNDGNAASDDAVEQRGFPDIRTAHNGY